MDKEKEQWLEEIGMNETDILQVEKILGFNFTQSQKRYLRAECDYEDINESLMPEKQIEYYKSHGMEKQIEGKLCGKTTAYIVKMLFDLSDYINFNSEVAMAFADMRGNYKQKRFFARSAKEIYEKLKGKGLKIVEWTNRRT